MDELHWEGTGHHSQLPGEWCVCVSVCLFVCPSVRLSVLVRRGKLFLSGQFLLFLLRVLMPSRRAETLHK